MRGVLRAVVWASCVIPLSGQAPPRYDIRQLDGAAFDERVHSDVTTYSGSAERQRTVVRTTRFGMAVRGDTLVVTADSLALQESADGADRAIDVDAVTGGRWKLMLDPGGAARVTTRPFVPAEVADVSDLGVAMDDFFPVAPPGGAAPGAAREVAGRTWRRLADSAGLARYRWSRRRQGDSSYVAADSVAIRTSSDSREDGDLAWDALRGPVAWSRRVETTVTSHFAGRTSRALVTQRIEVRRVP